VPWYTALSFAVPGLWHANLGVPEHPDGLPLNCALVVEPRRADMVLSYRVELIDVQLGCIRFGAVEEWRMDRSKNNIPQMELN
jgi:hypothetical protein